MAVTNAPTGSDLSARMGRSDPGTFDEQVDAARAWIDPRMRDDVTDALYRPGVLALAQAAVESVGNQGIVVTDVGAIYTRRLPPDTVRLMDTHGRAPFA